MKIQFKFDGDTVQAELRDRTIRVSADADTNLRQARHIETVLEDVLEARLGNRHFPHDQNWNEAVTVELGATVLEEDPPAPAVPQKDSKGNEIIY